ncbi:hypothetical protein VP01_1893g3 [Puccinia sorghi]|uniref:HAT C-terminal dimerisation domain-containing protein n=1 Tax=Puccinia sorghi TaxID=27349 RepID=A0A0L6VDH7_9BASI|nr:hypothetical protein VP01_1893g3 [Puccinia sorghi]
MIFSNSKIRSQGRATNKNEIESDGTYTEEGGIWFPVNTFHPIYHKMITKIEEYQEDALEYEALVMATLLHPAFHLRFFAPLWPGREKHLLSYCLWYLSSSASSCASEKIFSSESNVCSSGCGSLKSQTIDRGVSIHM